MKDAAKLAKVEAHKNIFSSNSIWRKDGILCAERRVVDVSVVKHEMDTRKFRLFVFRGRFFVTRADDDSIYYEYEGQNDGHGQD